MIHLAVADSSAVTRSVLKEIILKSAKLEYAGEASSSDELKSIALQKPDLFVFDESFFGQGKIGQILEFCSQGNFCALIFCCAQNISHLAQKNIRLLEKPDFIKFSGAKLQEYALFFEQTVLSLKREVLFENHISSSVLNADVISSSTAGGNEALAEMPAQHKGRRRTYKAVLVGVSTGGPATLVQLIKGIGRGFPLPVFITQHIDSVFDKNLIAWLCSETSVPVHLAADDAKPEPGHVYFAPADFHLVFALHGEDGFHIRLNSDAPVNFLRPSVDKMFQSAAATFGAECIALVLTGMGADGAKGCKLLKDSGAYTITQNEDTCVIYGMPKAAYEMGGSCEVLPLGQIAGRLWSLAGGRRAEE